MAFHVDEKRDMNIHVGDIQIDTAPGMYDVLDHNQKKCFNVQEVPFGSMAPRKVFEVNPDQVNEPHSDPLWDYISIIREEKFKHFKTRLLHKGRAFDKRTGRSKSTHPNSRLNRMNNQKDHKGLNFSLNMREQDQDSNVGPGMYYKDPVEQKLKKIKQAELAKKLVKKRKLEQKKQNSRLTSANRNRAPTIPDKNRSFGYQLTAKGTFKPLKNPLKEFTQVKSMLALERKLNSSKVSSSNSRSTNTSNRKKCQSAWAKSKLKRTLSLAHEQFQQDDYKKAILKEKTKHYLNNYVKQMEAKKKHTSHTRAFKKDNKKPSYPLPSGIVRASDQKYMENLQAIVDQEPGPGAYYDEQKYSSFNKSFKRLKYHEDFSLKVDRFTAPEDEKSTCQPGPGAYNQTQVKDVGFNQFENRKGVKVPFGTNEPRLKELRKNEFGEIDEDYISPGPGHSSNLDKDPKMIMAELRKQDILRQKSHSIKQNLSEKDEAFGPFRKKLKRERSKIPGPGLYHKNNNVRKEGCTGANFRSKTSRLKVFDDKKGKIPPPGYYRQDANTIAQNIVHPALRVNTDVEVSFNSHASRFGYNKKPNIYSQLKKVKQALTDEEKMLKVVQNLYRSGKMGVKYGGKEGVYYTDPFDAANLDKGSRAKSLGLKSGKAWTFNKSVSSNFKFSRVLTILGGEEHDGQTD